MTPAIFAELDAAIDRLQATVAILRFVEQRLPDRGSGADLAALNGIKVARERLVSLTSQLGSYAMAERHVDNGSKPYYAADTAAVPPDKSVEHIPETQAA